MIVATKEEERKLPSILSQDEVRAMLDSVEKHRDRVLITIAYACGLRVTEVATLKVADIDDKRMLVHVHSGKGRKNRLVPLAQSLLDLLRPWWKMARPTDWLFPGMRSGSHVDTRTIQRAVRVAVVKAGINKKVTQRPLPHDRGEGAALGFSLIRNHPFTDGNMRVGHAAIEATLVMNGRQLRSSIDEAERVILGVVAGTASRDDLVAWVRSCVVPG